ncbi:MAG: hypothetical protein II750_00475 [Bacteroidaceae bacterium]|nr:hypothetical protein [Bacteroidaceae bacterium]
MPTAVVGIEAGADAYLSKPFNSDELFARISQLLEQLGPHETQICSPTLYARVVAMPSGATA